jgi:hypothetical protein
MATNSVVNKFPEERAKGWRREMLKGGGAYAEVGFCLSFVTQLKSSTDIIIVYVTTVISVTYQTQILPLTTYIYCHDLGM